MFYSGDITLLCPTEDWAQACIIHGIPSLVSSSISLSVEKLFTMGLIFTKIVQRSLSTLIQRSSMIHPCHNVSIQGVADEGILPLPHPVGVGLACDSESSNLIEVAFITSYEMF